MSSSLYGKDYQRRMTIRLFEDMASETYDLLALGSKYTCVPSEETITDRHLLKMAAAELPCLQVFRATKYLESRCGFDWEWWVGSRTDGWIRYSVQAKKINMKTHRFSGIMQAVKGKLQISLLKEFARTHGSIPLYCFYSSELDWYARACWHCNETFDEKQLGCALAPLDDVEEKVGRKATKALAVLFERNVVPWRCLFKCNKNSSRYPFPQISHCWSEQPPSFRLYRELPKGAGDVVGSPELYASDSGVYPRRVVVFDTSRMRGNE